MHIEIWSVGKENDPFINDGLAYYFKKTKPYQDIQLHILSPAKKSATQDIDKTRQQEEALILKKLRPEHHLILLDERGKTLCSEEWAHQIQQCMNMGVRTLVFLIGGAYGVTDTIRQKAKQTWSLSRLVFPHQLVRLILAEQLYRSYNILHNTPYHHA